MDLVDVKGLVKVSLTRDQALEQLRALHGPGDPEINHGNADDILLALINDPEITEAFEAIDRWYA